MASPSHVQVRAVTQGARFGAVSVAVHQGARTPRTPPPRPRPASLLAWQDAFYRHPGILHPHPCRGTDSSSSMCRVHATSAPSTCQAPSDPLLTKAAKGLCPQRDCTHSWVGSRLRHPRAWWSQPGRLHDSSPGSCLGRSPLTRLGIQASWDSSPMYFLAPSLHLPRGPITSTIPDFHSMFLENRKDTM
jgi:hypothetical protein